MFHLITKRAPRALTSYIFINVNRNFSSQSEYKQANKKYDIIITGGGMIGTTLACTLGKNKVLGDKKILLLEGSDKKEYSLKEKYSNRVSSLNPGTFDLLNKIGVWTHIGDSRFAVVKKMQVWDALSEALITFCNDDMVENIAYIVENDVLLNAVYKEIQTVDTVDVIFKSKVKDFYLAEYNETESTVVLENGDSYSCNLLLGCDGANSQVRKAMKVQYLSWNYDQMGIVATLTLSEPMENVVSWQRFLPSGPIALLPLTENQCSLVWSTSKQHAKSLLTLSDEQFVDEVNDALWKVYKTNTIVDQATKYFDGLLKTMNAESSAIRQLPPTIANCQKESRAAFPLGFGHSTNYIGQGVALVGDAAHRIHPLAGQGVNLGFGDISCMDKVLEEATLCGARIDDLDYLKRYESERQKHNVPTMMAVDGLHRLYNTDFTPLVLLRSLGLQATHALQPLKKALISHAAQ